MRALAFERISDETAFDGLANGWDALTFFGCYADPDAFPSVNELPALLETEMIALGDATRTIRPRPFTPETVPTRSNGTPVRSPT